MWRRTAYLVKPLDQLGPEQNGAMAIRLEVDAYFKALCCCMQVLDARGSDKCLQL